MQFFHYYKTSEPAVLQARAADNKATDFIMGLGQAFADRFSAVAMFSRGFAPTFAGVGFTDVRPCKEPALWTKRSGTSLLQRPKDSGVPQKHRAASEALRLEWRTYFPQELTQPRKSELLAVLGFEDQTLLGVAIHYFEFEGHAYVASTRALKLPEILCSELVAAEVLARKAANAQSPR